MNNHVISDPVVTFITEACELDLHYFNTVDSPLVTCLDGAQEVSGYDPKIRLKALKADRRWFQRHPKRRFRFRRFVRGEAGDLTIISGGPAAIAVISISIHGNPFRTFIPVDQWMLSLKLKDKDCAELIQGFCGLDEVPDPARGYDLLRDIVGGDF